MSASTGSPASAGAHDERVRFCLQCGAVVPFDERTCSRCGHSEPMSSAAEDAGARRDCPGCGESLPADRSFCPRCGAIAPDEDEDAPVAASPGPAARSGAGGAADLLLAVLAPLLLAAALAWVFLDSLGAGAS